MEELLRIFSMMALPGSIRCSCQEENKDGAPSGRMNNHLLVWLRESYEISMHTYFHTSTRWGGCQFSQNAWEAEQKLLLKQHESLLFKMNHPSSLRMLWDTSQSGHKYSSPITDIFILLEGRNMFVIRQVRHPLGTPGRWAAECWATQTISQAISVVVIETTRCQVGAKIIVGTDSEASG